MAEVPDIAEIERNVENEIRRTNCNANVSVYGKSEKTNMLRPVTTRECMKENATRIIPAVKMF
jgi:hypothetical protein